MKLATLLALAGALIAGFFVAIQPGVNGQLTAKLGSPLRAGVVSFFVGCSSITFISLISGHGLPRPSNLSTLPPWMYLGGGMLGAVFVTTAMIVAPRIGATYWVGLVVLGQMLCSVILDHNGWLGFEQRPIDIGRVLAIGLILGGVLLIARR